MISQTVSHICRYLDSYEWEYEKLSDSTIVTGFLSEKSDTQFNLVVSVGEHWIGLTILPFLLKFPKEREERLRKAICQVNRNLKLARLAQTEADETVLCVDLPVQVLGEQFFHLALDVITYYADSLFPTLLSIWSDE